ncbi:MAG: hypothetical protein Q4A92_01875 [Corynebacterium sp.]|nr:hypothetical protein [Corynebacterium sp.]
MFSQVEKLKKHQKLFRIFTVVCCSAAVAAGAQGSSIALAEPPEVVVSETATGAQLGDVKVENLYGPGVVTQTALGNTVVGVIDGKQRIASNRFRASESGELASVRLYWPTGTGYSSGNGGKVKVSLVADDGSAGHFPNLSAEPLAVAYYEPKLVDGAKQDDGPLVPLLDFDTAHPITAGETYHVVLENIDPNPAENYISSDHSITHRDNGSPARWTDPNDWGSVIGYRNHLDTDSDFTWKDLTKEGSGDNLFVPIMELKMSDGTVQGNFDMESGSVVPDRITTITSEAPVRERFTPSENKQVKGISVATAVSVGGSLTWSIQDGDEVLATGTIDQPEANFSTHQTKKNEIAAYHWYDVTLPNTVEMHAGRTYDLVFRAEGSSEWKIGDHSNGSLYDVAWPAAFTESQAQHQHNGEWINTNHWDHTKSGKGTNWPVVLHLS